MGNVTLDVGRENVKERIEVPNDSVYLGAQGLTSIDLSPLSKSGKLENLWLYNNSIAHLDLSPLAFCSHLRYLSLRDNRLESLDLGPLGRCSHLEELDLADNTIESLDLEPLTNCGNLRQLDIGGNPFKQVILQPIESCANLRTLTMGGSESSPRDSEEQRCRSTGDGNPGAGNMQAVDLTPLSWCGQLSTLTLRGEIAVTLDPALWYIATAKVLRNATTITSAPEDRHSPVMAWMDKSIFSRLLPYRYESIAIQTGTANLRSVIIRNLKRVSRKYWFHAQKGLLEGLSLGELSGYDSNPLSILYIPSCPREYAAFRAVLRKHLVELIRKQVVAGGPTLFLNVDSLVAEDEPALAGMIVRARREEIEKLCLPTDGRIADITGLILTSYGHSIVRALKERRARLPLDEFEKVESALREAGLNVRTEQVKSSRFRSLARPRVSASLTSFVLESSLDLSRMKAADRINE